MLYTIKAHLPCLYSLDSQSAQDHVSCCYQEIMQLEEKAREKNQFDTQFYWAIRALYREIRVVSGFMRDHDPGSTSHYFTQQEQYAIKRIAECNEALGFLENPVYTTPPA